MTFAYDRNSPPVLEHFDLTIAARSSLAIVGQNGAGKTTLAKLPTAPDVSLLRRR